MEKSKVYRHRRFIYAEISVNVPEEGNPIGLVKKVVFANGRNHPRSNGFFRTADKDVQKALESHPEFNKAFVLEKVNGKQVTPTKDGVDKVTQLENALKAEQAKVKELTDDVNTLIAENEGLKLELKAVKEEKPTEPVKPEEPAKPEEPVKPEKKVIEVKNLQEAKEILKGEPYNVAANRMIQEQALLNRAEELNIEFKFPVE